MLCRLKSADLGSRLKSGSAGLDKLDQQQLDKLDQQQLDKLDQRELGKLDQRELDKLDQQELDKLVSAGSTSSGVLPDLNPEEEPQTETVKVT